MNEQENPAKAAPTRWAALVEYDGSEFRGWQTQSGEPTVQEAVERALTRVADHPVTVQCAGRTDSGVHATGQVIHFDTTAERDSEAWVRGGNANLPKAVALHWAVPVEPDFHARFSATARRYHYVIHSRPVRSTYLAHRTSWTHRALDTERMAIASHHLLGTHDFNAYRTVACQAPNPVRTIHTLNVQRRGRLIMLTIEANAFLHHMVRNIAGVLMAVGAGEADTDWPRQVLESRDRTQGGVTAPPGGLYLTGVRYPATFGLPPIPSLEEPDYHPLQDG